MSLCVYLTTREPVTREKAAAIFIRRNGSGREEISREEWDILHPGVEPVMTPVVDSCGELSTVFSSNITHNLRKMAEAAGMYQILWRPDEEGIQKAAALINPLEGGLAMLEENPDRFKILNPENGWGDYSGLVKFVKDYLDACKEFPTASVNVWR